jgi:adenine-specific DNA-methyltransferase
MLNLLVNYERPEEINRVAGIPKNWRRSDYNIRTKHLPLLKQLLNSINAPFLLVAFNDEGFIPIEEMNSMLGELGTVGVIKTRHAAFRGSRNFKKRPLHVTEHLFLVQRN